MNCWYCGFNLTWGGDHDLEEEEEDYCMVANLSCGNCGAFVLAYLPKDKEQEDV